MQLDKELVDMLLEAPDTQLDNSLFDEINAWDLNPSALDILFILDKIVCFSLASGFAVGIFQMLLDRAIDEENTTMVELTKQRNWTSPEFKRY